MEAEPSAHWSDADLSYILNVLMPNLNDRGRMIRVLREDREILDRMLDDARLYDDIMTGPDRLLIISGRLFFTVLLNRVRLDLRNQTFTFEKDQHYGVVIFDTAQVLDFLSDRLMVSYLASLLTSFVRIESRSIAVPGANGILRRVAVNDFDIESLIECGRLVGEDERAMVWKRVGEICLFLISVFSDYFDVQRAMPGAWHRTKSKKELAECGAYYFDAATRLGSALPPQLGHILSRLSREFLLAAKPLKYVASRYLGFIKRTAFLE